MKAKLVHAIIGDHVLLVPCLNLQIAHQTLVSSHTLSTVVGACKLVFMKPYLVHASIGDEVFLVPSPNLQDFSLTPNSISYPVSFSWCMQIGVHETLVGACKYW